MRHEIEAIVRGRGRRVSRRALVGGGAALAGAAAVARARSAALDRPAAVAPAIRQATELVVAISDTDEAAVSPLVEEYATLAKIAIRVEASPYTSLLEKLMINLTQGTGAFDVVSLDDPWMPYFAGGDYLVNLQELTEGRGFPLDLDVVPELLALGDFPPGSGLRAIPWLGNVQVFAWRTDVLAELGLSPPTTWDDVAAAARAITEAKGVTGLYGFGLRGQAGNPAATSFLPVLRGFGTDLFDDGWEPRLTTAEARAAMAAHLALARLAPPGVGSVGHRENGGHLAAGTIAQSGDIWPDQLLRVFDPASAVAGRVAIGTEPAQPGVTPVSMTGNWLLGIPRGSQNVEAALEFVLWFTAAEQQRRLLLERNMPPTRVGVLEDPEAVAKFPFLPGLLAAARTAVPRPRTPHYNAIEAILGAAVARALAGRVRGDDALFTANQEIRAYLVREAVLDE